MTTYYVHDGRNELGPFTIDILKKQKLTRSTPVREEGTNNWMAAEKISGLKALVAPKKIQRPKDIVPAVAERVTEFKQKHPKTMYVGLFCLAMMAGISIYSSGKAVVTTLPKNQDHLPSQMQTATTAPAGVPGKKLTDDIPLKEDKGKAARLHWNKLFSASNSNYGIGFLGGIKNLSVVINNKSDYVVDEAVAKITYIKSNGEVWKSKLVTVYGIPAHENKQQSVPDVGRGKKVTVSLQKIVSKKMKFNYVAGMKTANSEDPYLMQ